VASIQPSSLRNTADISTYSWGTVHEPGHILHTDVSTYVTIDAIPPSSVHTPQEAVVGLLQGKGSRIVLQWLVPLLPGGDGTSDARHRIAAALVKCRVAAEERPAEPVLSTACTDRCLSCLIMICQHRRTLHMCVCDVRTDGVCPYRNPRTGATCQGH
jgi:hypothetical protein